MDSVSLIKYWTDSSDRDYESIEQIENIKEIRTWLKKMLI